MPVREKGERLKTNTCVRSHATRLICLAVRQIVRPRLPRASPRLSAEESRGAQLLVVECVVRRAAWLDTRGATRSLVPPLVRRWLNAVDSSTRPSRGRAVRRRVTVFELCFCAVLARDRGFSFARWPASFFRVFRPRERYTARPTEWTILRKISILKFRVILIISYFFFYLSRFRVFSRLIQNFKRDSIKKERKGEKLASRNYCFSVTSRASPFLRLFLSSDCRREGGQERLNLCV